MLRTWADFYVGYERAYQEGLTLGFLASEIIKTDLDVHDELASAFDQGRGIFCDGIERMQQLGRISAEAAPTLATSLDVGASKLDFTLFSDPDVHASDAVALAFAGALGLVLVIAPLVGGAVAGRLCGGPSAAQ